METLSSSPVFSAGWRHAAVRIVEELFGQLPVSSWDPLLELRGRLLQDAPLEEVLDQFLICRQGYEQEAYLPFYRLRTLLATSLTLQGRGEFQSLPLPPLEFLLRQKHGSLAEWKRQLEREWFEQGMEPDRLQDAGLSLAEVV